MNRYGTVYGFSMPSKVWHRFALLGQGKANLLKAINSNNGTGSTIPNRGDEAMDDTAQRARNVNSETNLSAEEQVMVPRSERPGTQPVISPPMRLGFPDSFETHQLSQVEGRGATGPAAREDLCKRCHRFANYLNIAGQ